MSGNEADLEDFEGQSAPAKKEEGGYLEITQKYADHLCGNPFIKPHRIRKYLKKRCTGRVSHRASAALAGIIQALTLILFEWIINFRDNDNFFMQKSRITPKLIARTISGNDEFAQLLSNVLIPSSGMFGIINGDQPEKLESDDEPEEVPRVSKKWIDKLSLVKNDKKIEWIHNKINP